MDTNKSTSRRQGRLREEGSEGSRSANVRGDGQKPHTRLSSWASRHNTSEAHRFGSRVNAAFVHGRFTFLSGEICMSRGRSIMREGRRRFTRLTRNPAHPSAVGGCESRPPRPFGRLRATPPCQGGELWETQSRQQLMSLSVAPCMETYGVSMQKSAEGIVLPVKRKEGPNVEMRMTLS